MSRLKRGDTVWWISPEGHPRRAVFHFRRGREVRLITDDPWWPFTQYRFWHVRAEVFRAYEDCENFAHVVRQWIAEDAGVVDVGGSPNG